MREELIGYLLGALDAKEQAEVEQALADSKELRQELDELAADLQPLEADAGDYDPPVGLATRTCQFVAQHTQVTPLRPTHEPLVSIGRWSLTDMLVAASVCAAAVLLFLPAIAESRHQASLAYCQNNLRAIGNGLTSYSESNRGYFPAIPAQGKFSFAGYFAPTLVEQGFQTDQTKFFCTPRAEQSVAGDSTGPVSFIPTTSQLATAEGRELAELIKRSGGDYAYALGYIENGQLQAVRNRHRANFAILSDTPNLDGTSRVSLNHGGKGQNVLFEDGHTRYVTSCRLGCGDNLFLNDAGFPEAGIHADDAVLGHSSMPPVHSVRLDLDR